MMKQLAFVLAVACAAPLGSAQAQTELKAYADADGYINVQKLTCAQLAGTYQEDANFLGVWYSGTMASERSRPSTCPEFEKAFTS
ncbi:hypothetical protein [Tardiphaga sp.]|uniref:hypothetical protein n=1 Tax=Tardiphaga sp. TaxID=1926292 RepID=UPI00352ADA50